MHTLQVGLSVKDPSAFAVYTTNDSLENFAVIGTEFSKLSSECVSVYLTMVHIC